MKFLKLKYNVNARNVWMFGLKLYFSNYTFTCLPFKVSKDIPITKKDGQSPKIMD